MSYDLTSLSERLREQISEIKPTAHGRGKTYQCLLKNGDIAYLKIEIDQSVERLALEKLKQLAIEPKVSPEILEHCEASNSILLSAMPGVHPNKTALVQDLSIFCQRLTQVHRTLSISNLDVLDISTLLRNLNFKGAEKYADLALKELLSYPFSNRDITVLHGDLNATNILMSDQNWHFIDWEFCTQGDVRWDLAAVCVEFELNQNETAALLSTYRNSQNVFFEKQRVDNTKCEMHTIKKDDFEMWKKAYALVCLGWSLEHDQPVDKYRQLLKTDG